MRDAAAAGSGEEGVGYSYADPAAARLVHEPLAQEVKSLDALANGHAWQIMTRAVRNAGRPGIASATVSAVDNTLWDLKGKLLDVSVAVLLSRV